MPGDIKGLGYTTAIIVLSFVVSSFFKNEAQRKIVHIGVSNFAFVYLFVFENDILPLIGLIYFAVFNYREIVRKEKEALVADTETPEELKVATKRRYGTVYYPLAISLLIVLKYCGIGSSLAVATATLCMGYGDGLSAILGKRFSLPKMPFSKDKTLAGFLTVFVMTVIISFAMYYFVAGQVVLGKAFLCGLCTALAELYTPYGLDNFSVPVVCYLICCLF